MLNVERLAFGYQKFVQSRATKKGRRNRAVSPAISTVIVTGAVVSLVTVALAYANNLLLYRLAASEFDSSKQFMKTIGLQIDDVAWVVGLTETVRYSSRHGDVKLESALNYTIYVNDQVLYSNISNIICFNMPTSQYSIANDYFELIYPSDNEFLSEGSSAPVTRVSVVQRSPMADGSFVRLVDVPIIRMVQSTIADTTYVRLYLPILRIGETPRKSQSVSLTGNSIVTMIEEGVTEIKVELNFPQSSFDNFFFKFPYTEKSIALAESAVLELYVGTIDVSLGVHN